MNGALYPTQQRIQASLLSDRVPGSDVYTHRFWQENNAPNIK